MALKAGRVGVAPDQVDSYGKIEGAGYTLPVASADTLGGVKVGSGLTMTDGVLSSDNPTPYTLPAASADTLGGVKVGSGLTMTDGVLSASGGGGTTLKTKEVTKATDWGTATGSGLYYNTWTYSDLGIAKDDIVALVKICSDYNRMRDVLLTSNHLVILSTQQGEYITVRITYKE